MMFRFRFGWRRTRHEPDPPPPQGEEFFVAKLIQISGQIPKEYLGSAVRVWPGRESIDGITKEKLYVARIIPNGPDFWVSDRMIEREWFVHTKTTLAVPPARPSLPNAYARIAPPAEQDLIDAAREVIASFHMNSTSVKFHIDSQSIKKLTAAIERYEAWADFRDMMIGTIRNGPPALPPGGKS